MKQFLLANPGILRDKLVGAVLKGKKTATSSLLSDWQNENLPSVGERQLLIDSDGNAVGTVEISKVEQCRLGDIGWDIARAEGESFADVPAWRRAHESLWLSDKYQPSTKKWQLSDDTIVVIEHFRLVDRL